MRPGEKTYASGASDDGEDDGVGNSRQGIASEAGPRRALSVCPAVLETVDTPLDPVHDSEFIPL